MSRNWICWAEERTELRTTTRIDNLFRMTETRPSVVTWDPPHPSKTAKGGAAGQKKNAHYLESLTVAWMPAYAEPCSAGRAWRPVPTRFVERRASSPVNIAAFLSAGGGTDTCSWIACRSLLSSGCTWRYGPVIAFAASSAVP